MNDVERLEYYNGRRLDATDLRLEQRYHIQMRRRLNRALFTPGVVSGLEVTQVAGSTTKVRVAPGLALDPLGREIVVDEQTLAVPGQPPAKGNDGYILVVRYREERLPADDDPCRPPGGAQYARIVERPELAWTEEPPLHARCAQDPSSLDCAVMLAFVRVSTACEIEEIVVGVREYVHPAHTSQVAAFELEGEKDIDKDNPKRLHFTIRGGAPTAVSLYLWGDKFSSLFYTELGHHTHVLKKESLKLSSAAFPDHKHGLEVHRHKVTTAADGKAETDSTDLSHSHKILTEFVHGDASRTVVPYVAVATVRQDWQQVDYFEHSEHVGAQTQVGRKVGAPWPWIEKISLEHTHKFSFELGDPVKPDGNPTTGLTEGLSGSVGSLSHSVEQDATVTSAGSPDYAAGSDAAYQYLANLRVELDGTDITDRLLKQLGWTQLGAGAEEFGHALNSASGTGELDLLDAAASAGKAISEGTHTLLFKVASGGGKVLYNLYVQ